MRPEDVYAVYDSRNDVILSVHSLREYAQGARKELVNDEVARRSRFTVVSSDELAAINMHYSIATLAEAINWLTMDNIEDYAH